MEKDILIRSLKEVANASDFQIALKRLKDSLPIPDSLPSLFYYPIVLIGGGSGTPVVGRSLYLKGQSFTMIANPTDTLRSKETREPVGAGLLKENLQAPDWVDITKQLLHSTPKEKWDKLREILESKPWPDMRLAYLVLEALRQITGDVQGSINLLGSWLGNPYEVIPSTTAATEAMYYKSGKKYNLYDFALSGLSLPDKIELEPSAGLNPAAKQALLRAKSLIIGPGDVHFSILPHFYVEGFSEALEKSSGKLILIANLTAREIDIPHFSLSDFLDLFSRYLPSREVTVVVNRGDLPAGVENKLKDNIKGVYYKNFVLQREKVAGDELNNNKQPVHDIERLGGVLVKLLSN